MRLTKQTLKKLIMEVIKENETAPIRITADYQKMMDELDDQLKAKVGPEKYEKIKNLEKDEPEQAAELARVFVGDKYPQRLSGEDLIDRTFFKAGYKRTAINTEFEEESTFFGLIKKKIYLKQMRTYEKRSNQVSSDLDRNRAAIGTKIGDKLKLRIVADVMDDKFPQFTVGLYALVPKKISRQREDHYDTVTRYIRQVKWKGMPQDEKQLTDLYQDQLSDMMDSSLYAALAKRVEEMEEDYGIK